MAISRNLRFQVLRRDEHTCRYCGGSAPDVKLTVDHVVPQTLGGKDEPANLVTACVSCNGGKAATPPDSSQVSNVSDDALRWARAMQEAAQKRLADQREKEAYVAAFEKEWNRWKIGAGKQQRTVPLPDDYARSLERFRSAGLPLEIVQTAVRTAMENKRITVEKLWRYFCGICWRELEDIQEAAAAIAKSDARQGQESPVDRIAALTHEERDMIESPAESRGMVQAASDLVLEHLSEGEVIEFRRQARFFAEEAGGELSTEDDELYLAAFHATEEIHQEVMRLDLLVNKTLERIPQKVREYLLEGAEHDHVAKAGNEYNERDVKYWAVTLLGMEIESGSIAISVVGES